MKWVQREAIEKYNDDDLLVEKVRKVRGVQNLSDWINPPSKYVNSPYLLDNIDDAVTRIIKAIHKEEKIQIVADIDTDGVCSTGIMFNYLKELTSNLSFVHAQRSEGHGIETVLDKIEDNTELIIIVDSSSNSVEGCKELHDKGKDIIIIDHHAIDVKNPFATIVNCQLGKYPNKHLSGSAMVYKVCQVIDEYIGTDFADDFLDLASIGLVGDMMPIDIMENRYLIYNGINKIDNIGIKEILKQSNIDFNEGITTTNISYKIAPIIGACSRFDKIELALELLTTDSEERVKELTKQMIEMNEKRKSEQKGTVEKVIEDIDVSDNIIIVIANEIESGFRGLIATEIVERYSKPVFVLTEFYNDKEELVSYTGSARSVGLIELKSMCQDSGLFKFATGHEQAFGVSFKAENLDDVIKFFNDRLDEDDLQKVVEYDLEFDVNDIDEFDIKQIEKFSKIVGQGFPEPKFRISGIIVEEGHTKKLGNHIRAVMGANFDTIKIHAENNFALMKFRSNDKFGLEIEKHYYDDDNFVTELECVGSLNLNKFYNWVLKSWVYTNQIFIEDYKIID